MNEHAATESADDDDDDSAIDDKHDDSDNSSRSGGSGSGSDANHDSGIPLRTAYAWALFMADLERYARAGRWHARLTVRHDAMCDMLHMFSRCGFAIVDFVRVFHGTEPVLYSCSLDWRKAKRGAAFRFKRLAKQYHFKTIGNARHH